MARTRSKARSNVIYETKLGTSIVADCLDYLAHTPDNSFDLVITSPPYDGQPRYGNGETYERSWFTGFFRQVAAELLRTLKPRGSFVLNYRSKRNGRGRGTLQFELIFLLQAQGFLFCEDYVWAKPSPPPGHFSRYLKDAVEYCFHFAKTPNWQFFPKQCLMPARWDAVDRARRQRSERNFQREVAPSGHGRRRVQAGPDLVRPSNVLLIEPEFGPNPTRHPARFPVLLPAFFVQLLTKPGQLVYDPFGGTGTTAVAAEFLGRRWVVTETERAYAKAVRSRMDTGRDARALNALLPAPRRPRHRAQTSGAK